MHSLQAIERQFQLHSWGVSLMQEPDVQIPYRGEPCMKQYYRPRLQCNSQMVMEPPPVGYEPRYMDIRKDYSFKRVFGTEANKDLLIHFLNSLFEGEKVIDDVQFRPTERLGEDEATRTVIYDVVCTSDQGEHFLIEMQRVYQAFFANRIFYYGSRLVSGQVPAGKAGDNFDINAVYTIGLLDFMLWEDPALLADPVRRYMRSADVSWTDTRETFREAKWIFIQLPGFDKKLEELNSDLERWIYLVNNLHLMKERPASLDDPAFRKLFNINEIDTLNPEELRMYKLTIDGDRDWRNALSHAKDEGRTEEKLSFVRNLIKDTRFKDQKIAALAGLEESLVRKMRLN